MDAIQKAKYNQLLHNTQKECNRLQANIFNLDVEIRRGHTDLIPELEQKKRELQVIQDRLHNLYNEENLHLYTIL